MVTESSRQSNWLSDRKTKTSWAKEWVFQSPHLWKCVSKFFHCRSSRWFARSGNGVQNLQDQALLRTHSVSPRVQESWLSEKLSGDAAVSTGHGHSYIEKGTLKWTDTRQRLYSNLHRKQSDPISLHKIAKVYRCVLLSYLSRQCKWKFLNVCKVFIRWKDKCQVLQFTGWYYYYHIN